MKTRIRPAMTIAKASYYVNHFGELMATNDKKRFFPIDGLVVFASPGDVTEMDTIKPFQFTRDGKSDYYKTVCTSDADANGDPGRTDESHPEDEKGSGTELNMRYETEQNYDEMSEREMSEREEIEEFIADMDKSVKGCLYRLFIIVTIVFMLLIFLYK